jgi:myosin-crossreactive antigen
VLSKRNGSHYKRHHPTQTMNDLPKPEGDFFILNAQRQKKNNLILGAGIASFATALYLVRLKIGFFIFNI